ncbi:MAG TPA: DNA-directed RNA polymerase subunit alpha [Balneolaceae bacterium]|nr:DNA-directed RNA polymerase subunit alpha [Balneolaceae bacterium]
MSNYTIQMPEELHVEEAEDTHGIFVLQPLERGFGVTVGNSFRRILLSSLPGAAISAIRIEGVEHEYSSIKGVKEDVYEIILNLKEVRFKQKEDSDGTIIISKKGKGKLTAADIAEATNDYDVLNPDLVIANIADDTQIDLELKVTRGRGYVPAEEQNVNTDDDITIIPIDAVYTPIKQVKFDVDNVRVGQRTDYEKLIIDVTTDGSVTAKEALTIAGKILKDHVQRFITVEIDEPFTQEEQEMDAEKQRIAELLETNIEELNLSVRSYNCLKSADVDTIAELVSREKSELLKFRNFGKKSLQELEEVIEDRGLHFDMDVTEYLDN